MDQAKRTLSFIVGSFAVLAVSTVVVLSLVDLGEPAEPDLSDGALLAVLVFGSIGLLLALLWSARAGDTTTTPNRLMVGFVTRVAIAELGLLLGILGLVMTGAILPAYVGLGLFLGSLLFLALGLGRVPNETG